MDGEVQRVLDAIGALKDIGDAKERALAVGELLARWPDQHQELRVARQEAVKELLASGLSYRKVGAELGIHFTRVKQIADGVTNPRAAKKSGVESEGGQVEE